MKNISYLVLILVLFIQFAAAETSVKIVSASGNAKVRFGLEEEWNKAVIGIDLKEIDTILTGENGEIVLQFNNGKKFILGRNSILDIGDLREIQEKELFLFLMSKKVEKIEPRKEKTKLRIGDVSVVYGESKTNSDSSQSESIGNSLAKKEVNGVLALFMQHYYTNTLYKLHNLLDKYKTKINLGKVYFYIARAFEALDKNGQAIDAYQIVVDTYEKMDSLNPEEIEYLIKSKNAIKILKK